VLLAGRRILSWDRVRRGFEVVETKCKPEHLLAPGEIQPRRAKPLVMCAGSTSPRAGFGNDERAEALLFPPACSFERFPRDLSSVGVDGNGVFHADRVTAGEHDDHRRAFA